MRNDNTRERLKVENITQRYRKARLRWFGREETRPIIRRKKDSGDGTTWEKKARKIEAVPFDCGNRDTTIGTTKYEVHDRTGCRRIVSAAANPQLSGNDLKKTCVYGVM